MFPKTVAVKIIRSEVAQKEKANEASNEKVVINVGGADTVYLNAEAGAAYQLINNETGYAPENIMTKRVGNDLWVAFEGEEISHPSLVLNDFYKVNEHSCEGGLIGMAENGHIYAYVPESALEQNSVHLLADQMTAGQALGGENFDAALVPWWPGIVGALGSAGLIAALWPKHTHHEEAVVLPVAPSAPSVSIISDVNHDHKISIDEVNADGTIDIHYGLGKNAKVGDTLTISTPDGKTEKVSLTDKDIAAGGINRKYTVNDTDKEINSSATLTDKSGHTSAEGKDQVVVVRSPKAPTVSIEDDSNHDGILTKDELTGSSVTVHYNITDAKAGDTLTITKPDGSNDSITLSDADISRGYIEKSYSVPADGATLITSATLTDAAGNTSAPGSNSATVNTVALTTPTVTIDNDANHDGKLNTDEVTDGRMHVTINPGKDAKPGDTLTITNPQGEKETVKLTADDIKDGIKRDYPVTDDGSTPSITATLTDPNGNSSGEGKATAEVDKTAPSAPSVEITSDANHDGILGTDDIAGGNVTVHYGLSDAKAGDTLTITKPDGSNDSITLSDADISRGYIEKSYSVPADGATLTTSATLTDAAGNTSAPGSNSATVNTAALTTPTVTIDNDANNDGKLNTDEVKDGKIHVTIDPGKDAKPGDTLTITNPQGEKETVKLTADDIKDGIKRDYPATDDGSTPSVTVKLTDPNGNSSGEGKVTAEVDKTAPAAPSVMITSDANHDGVLGAGEIKDGNVTVHYGLNHAKAGDTLNITKPDGQPEAVKLTQPDIERGYIEKTYSAPQNGAEIHTKATLTDAVGNVSAEAEASATVHADKLAHQPSIVVDNDDQPRDGILNKAETPDNRMHVTIHPGEGAKAGDSVVITAPDGKQETVELTDAEIKDGIKRDYPVSGGEDATVQAKLVDTNGNSSDAATASVHVDTTAPTAPEVHILSDKNGDSQIDMAELTDSKGAVAIRYQFDKSVVSKGDTLTITTPMNTTDIVHLKEVDIRHGYVDKSYVLPKGTTEIDTSATLTDKAKNVSPEGHAHATLVDNNPPSAPEFSDNGVFIRGKASEHDVVTHLHSTDKEDDLDPNKHVTYQWDKSMNTEDQGYYTLAADTGVVTLTAAGADYLNVSSG